ncbi:MAG: Uma2 family endonuclease [Chloroflexi bacterium]|nr:Uma2 family endonuclease [Chloroflexota bacterium]
MTITTERRIITADELFSMPDDGYRYELVRGELRKTAPASDEHGEYAGYIAINLGSYVMRHRLGKIYIAETGFILDRNPDLVRAPAVSFVRRERTDAIGRQRGYWHEAPDLVVEVISPHDHYTEVDEKVADWLAAGTRMVVVVNPRNKTVRVHRSPTEVVSLTITDTLDGGDVVQGWYMPLTEIFAD